MARGRRPAGDGDGRGRRGHRRPHAGGGRRRHRPGGGRGGRRRACAEELGPVDLLVNNAGLIDAAEVPLWEADPDQWWDVVSSHVRGPFLLVRTVVPWMVLREPRPGGQHRQRHGHPGQPRVLAPTRSRKTGLMRITEALAAALEGSDVRAFDVAPGVVDTPMTRSMHMWPGCTDWTPPEQVVELVAAIAAGRAGPVVGPLLRAGADDLDVAARHHARRRRPAAAPAPVRGRPTPAEPEPRRRQTIVASARGAMSTATGVSASSSISSPSSCSGMGASVVKA